MSIIKQIFTYTLSAVTLIISLIGTSIFFVNLLSTTYFAGYVDSFDNYTMSIRSECNSLLEYKPTVGVSAPYSRFSREECTKFMTDREAVRPMYDTMIKDSMDNERRNEIGKMINAIPWMIVPLPLFFWFNRLRKQSEK